MCVTLLTLFPGKTYEKDTSFEQTKLRCGKAERAEDAPENEVETLATGGRLLQRTRYKMSTPQFRGGNPLAPEKGAFPLDHFGECATFKETYLKCLQVRHYVLLRSMLKRDGITLLLTLYSSSFTRSK